MAWWYVRRASGENVGPIEDASVVLELDAGRLPPNGWIFEAGGTAWRRVDEVTQFSGAVRRSMEALGDAPTLYSAETKKEQKSLAALYEAHVEAAPGPPSPSRPPTPPAPTAPNALSAQAFPVAPGPVVAAAHAVGARPHGTAPMAASAQQPAQIGSSGVRNAPVGYSAPIPAPAAPQLAPQPALAQATPAHYDASVKGPASSVAPYEVDNPLTEARGATGWLAIGFAAATALLYFMGGSVGLVALAFGQSAVILSVVSALFSYACVGLFAWCAVGLFRRQERAYRVAMGAHAALMLLVILGVFVQAMLRGGFHWILLTPSVLVIDHVLGISFAYAARGVFWIRT